MAARQFYSHGFGPVFDERSRILILGSFPSVRSRQAQFFYAHPRNRFWPVLAAIFDEATPVGTESQRLFLLRNGIALYDVIESCSVIASSDSSIADVTPADLSPILSVGQIRGRVFANGMRALALSRRYLEPRYGFVTRGLPSTSPANAARSLDDLTEAWRGPILSALAEY